MYVKNNAYGMFDVDLDDDGTLDTVISVYHPYHGTKQIRFSQEYGAEFRDDTGAMTDDGFDELAQESVEAYIEQYLI